MKTFLLALVLICAAVFATDFNVRCPHCLARQTLASTNIFTTGGYAFATNGLTGIMQQRSAQFHCLLCGVDFSSPIKPDQFIPVTVATPATNAPTAVVPPPATAPVDPGDTNLVFLTVVQLPDGGELVIFRRVK